MKVLVACEYSGRVRDAFHRRGHDAWSCDLLPSESDLTDKHIQGDVLYVMAPVWGWDLIIAHPDCTYLTGAGAWLFADKIKRNIKPGVLTGAARREAREKALDFVRIFLEEVECERVAVENPVGCIGTRIRPADQYIQPNQFGHDASKKTGLWLKNLPKLEPTKIIEPRWVDGKPRWGNQTDSGQNKLAPSENRWKDRSRTYSGIADAMAEQWGNLKDIQ